MHLVFAGLFALAPSEMTRPISKELSPDFAQESIESVIKTGPLKETSMRGVFVCGDAAWSMAPIALAVGDGTLSMPGRTVHLCLSKPYAAKPSPRCDYLSTQP